MDQLIRAFLSRPSSYALLHSERTIWAHEYVYLHVHAPGERGPSVSGTHVNVSASAAHTSFVHVAPQRSHGDVPDGRIAKDRSTGSHCGGHVTASPIAREDASSIVPHVKENTSSNTLRFPGSHPAFLLQQGCRPFSYVVARFTPCNSCRGNSFSGRCSRCLQPAYSTTRLPEATATQRRSSCRLRARVYPVQFTVY